MPLIASEDSAPIELAPMGTHVANCAWIIDLGTQKEEYDGKPKLQHKVMVFFELSDTRHVFSEEKGPEPFFVHKEYTLSLSSQANLRSDLEGWRGRAFTPEELIGFDLEKILAKPCYLSITHKTSRKKRDYVAINSIIKLPAGTSVPKMIATPLFYTIDMGKNDIFAKVPEWIQKKIQLSQEWTNPAGNAASSQSADQQGSADEPF